MLFAPIEGLTASLVRSEQAEDLDNAEPIIVLEQGAAISQLQQYQAIDRNDDLNGFWALQVAEPLPLNPEMLKDAWLVIKYQLELQSNTS